MQFNFSMRIKSFDSQMTIQFNSTKVSALDAEEDTKRRQNMPFQKEKPWCKLIQTGIIST